MSNQTHDKTIAKLQHFSDSLHNRKCEKEALSLSLDKSEEKTQIYNQILIYEEIIDEYHKVFEDILYR